MRKKQFTAKRIALDAVLVALYLLFSMYFKINIGQTMKLSIASIPIIVGAMMFGPKDALIVSLVGTFLEQALGEYGLVITTPLFMLPYIIPAVIIGFISARNHYRCSSIQIMVITICAELLITTLNTAGIYMDSKISGYYSPAIWVPVPTRYLLAVAKGVACGLLLPPLLKELNRLSDNSNE